jgi:hypothetical protein
MTNDLPLLANFLFFNILSLRFLCLTFILRKFLPDNENLGFLAFA